MIEAHGVEAIRAAEAAVAALVGWDTLMQRAAAGLADLLADLVPPDEPILALIGPGNNGGDALFAAARLCERGRRVHLSLLDPDRAHPEGLAAATAAGATVVDGPRGHRYVVDALFGIGARPGLRGRAAEWAASLRADDSIVVAVDLPSGVDVDGATLPGAHVTAHHTVTFGSRKVALVADPAASVAGTVHLVDIGLGPHLGPPAVEAIERTDGAGQFRDRLVGSGAEHKYQRGVVGIAAGSPQYAGAAHLCVAGAQAGPSGMVRFVGDPDLARRVVDRAPEVVAGDGRVQAWVVGPGAGEDIGERLEVALAAGVPLVVDAGALTHLPPRLAVPALLTPHAGELATMLGVGRDEVEAAPCQHARTAAVRWGATVLLKGRRTLVVPAEGAPARVNLSGTGWLATAGSGDVLAGLAGSLLAAGLDTLDAGSHAAFLHGAAGVRASRGGPIVASDVARALPGVLADFLSGSLETVGDR